MNNHLLKHLVQRFDALSMPNPAKQVYHPYEFIARNFPTYDDFYNYFIDLESSHKSEGLFGDVLFEIYHDLRNLPVAVSGMNHGIKPENMKKIANSMRTFTELTRKKYAQANTMLAQNYSTKH